MDRSKIRNFSIVAHIDHGKSTLADRILEQTKAVPLREMENQLLDNMDLERERGITIKAHAVTLVYTAQDGEDYIFNLIDTPGHVDFNYEVSRSLAACEGAVLVVDASQGIEAQTLANTYLAVDAGLEILPVVNKIDLPSADPERVCHEIEDVIGIPAMDAPRISAKTGENIQEVMERIVTDIPAPGGNENDPLRALIFDSYYDAYRGVIVYVRIKDGQVRPGDTIRMMATGGEFNVVECGFLRATTLEPAEALYAGEVGYIAASIKDVRQARVGDTVTLKERPAAEPLEGYRAVQPMVFCGIYPADGAHYTDLRDALEKLQLNDASLTFEPETSVALGFGFRCGFLGLLHMEIIQERLEREYDLDLITTAPSVVYKLKLTDGSVITIDNPTNYPDPTLIAKRRGAHLQRPHLLPLGVRGQHHGAVPGAPGRVQGHEVPGHRPGGHPLRAALKRDRLRLFRRLEVPHPGLRFLRLRAHGLPAQQAGEAGHHAQRGDRGRSLLHHPRGQGLSPGPENGGEAEGEDTPPAVRGAHPGLRGGQDHRPGDGEGPAQRRAGQVLRRRHYPEEEAAGKAEGGQKAHAPAGQRRGAPGGVHVRAEAG